MHITKITYIQNLIITLLLNELAAWCVFYWYSYLTSNYFVQISIIIWLKYLTQRVRSNPTHITYANKNYKSKLLRSQVYFTVKCISVWFLIRISTYIRFSHLQVPRQQTTSHRLRYTEDECLLTIHVLPARIVQRWFIRFFYLFIYKTYIYE